MTQKNVTQVDTGRDLRTGIGGTAKEAAQHLASDARAELDARVAGKKRQAGDELSSVAEALRDTSEDLRQRVPAVGDYAERTADTIDDLAGFLRDKSAGEIVEDIQRFARREPALFFGGAFALGVVAARFLKSSPSSGASYSPPSTQTSSETSSQTSSETFADSDPIRDEEDLPEGWGAV